MDENKDVSVYTDSINDAISEIPQAYLDMSDDGLEKEAQPNLKLYELKRKFWDEIFAAQERGGKMRPKNIYNGIMSDTMFYNRILKNHAKVAWLISPLTTYENRTKAALDKVTKRYEELITMDITTKKFKKVGDKVVEWTETDPRKALVLLQTIKNLEERIHGTAIQRQVNVHTNTPSDKQGRATLDMDKIDKRLKELELLTDIKPGITNESERKDSSLEEYNGHDGQESRRNREGDKGKERNLARFPDSGRKEDVEIQREDIRQL